MDRITEFSVVDATIYTESAIFTKLTTSDRLASSAFPVGSAAHDSTDRIVYDKAEAPPCLSGLTLALRLGASSLRYSQALQ